MTPAGSFLNIANGVNSTADLLTNSNIDDLFDGEAPDDNASPWQNDRIANERGGNYFSQNKQVARSPIEKTVASSADQKKALVQAMMGRPGYTYSGKGIIHTS